MKVCSKCPRCNTVLSQDYLEPTGGWVYKCPNAAHTFKGLVTKSEPEVFNFLSTSLDTSTRITWHFDFKFVEVVKVHPTRQQSIQSSTQLPWFEPDFTNIARLIKKIQTYLLFS